MLNEMVLRETVPPVASLDQGPLGGSEHAE